MCEGAQPVSNVLEHFDPCQVIVDCTLLCNVRRSICCNRASRPSADQKCRHSPPMIEITRFSPPPPQKGIFSLIPQNDLKDQRRRLIDPLRNNV